MLIPRSLEGFNVAAAVARLLDQPTLWWQAVGLFVTYFSTWEKDWLQCVGDDARERKQVHAVRSAAANIGAEGLAAAAASLEEALLVRCAGDEKLLPILRQNLAERFREAWGAAARAANVGEVER